MKSFLSRHSPGLIQPTRGQGRNVPQPLALGSTQLKACMCAKRWQTWVWLHCGISVFCDIGFVARMLEPLVTKEGRAREDLLHLLQPLPFTDGTLRGQSPRIPAVESGTHSIGPTGRLPPRGPSCFCVLFPLCVLSSYFTCFALVSPLSQKSRRHQARELLYESAVMKAGQMAGALPVLSQPIQMPACFQRRAHFSTEAQLPCFLF